MSSPHPVEAFFNPKSIAIVGATNRPGTWGYFVMLGLTGGQELEISARDGRIEVDVAPVMMQLEEQDGIVTAVPAEPLPSLSTQLVREVLERTRR